MADPSREELVAICEDAIVPEKHWYNRDSAGAHRQLGEAWAQLKAGCEFTVLEQKKGVIRIEIRAQGFQYHEYGPDADGKDTRDEETYYLPSRKRLEEKTETVQHDWYG